MIEEIKASKSEKILFIFLILLGLFSITSFFMIKNKCLFVKNYDPSELKFENPQNIAILNVECGNVIIELYPETSPIAVERFKTLIKSQAYDDVAFHRVVKNEFVQSGDIEFGKKYFLDYGKVGTGKSGLGTIKSEIDNPFNYDKGSVGLARNKQYDTEDSQFFIILEDKPLYESEYTPVGKVLYGLDVLMKVKYSNKSDYVLRPDYINSFRMLVN